MSPTARASARPLPILLIAPPLILSFGPKPPQLHVALGVLQRVEHALGVSLRHLLTAVFEAFEVGFADACVAVFGASVATTPVSALLTLPLAAVSLAGVTS